MAEYIIAVDEFDNEIGSIEKIEAHYKGILNRAFSILVFNSNSQLLLQKRSLKKYHSPGLWTNTCCSHPQYGEVIPNNEEVDDFKWADINHIKNDIKVNLELYTYWFKTLINRIEDKDISRLMQR